MKLTMKPMDGPEIILAHQPRIPHDVRDENRSQMARDAEGPHIEHRWQTGRLSMGNRIDQHGSALQLEERRRVSALCCCTMSPRFSSHPASLHLPWGRAPVTWRETADPAQTVSLRSLPSHGPSGLQGRRTAA